MIADQGRLDALVPRIVDSPWVAIDTEADSLHAYPEKLCLMQISLPDGDELLDTLAGLSLDELLDAFCDHELILHGADYDLRLLKRTYDFELDRLFDTMIAARLLGETQFGLGHLVQKFLSITLEKGPQKMNWAQRPLTPRMEAYARNDTRYLKPLSELLRKELKARGRLSWLEQSCAQLIRDCAILRAPDPDAWRLKGSDRLTDRGRAVLREIWQWREKEAIAANRPPFFVLSHDDMVMVAAQSSHVAFDELRLPARFSARRRETLLDAIERGLRVSEKDLPKRKPREFNHPDVQMLRRFHNLKKKRDEAAAKLQLDPTLIAPKADLLELARDSGEADHHMLPWQLSLLGLDKK
ncbi:MAG TPA: HRDC domain-containing protein [Verrucomicrobiae bacterium]|nr:HRDC domain-containing protein [Verrucomicrobiae bacterium]